MWNGSIKKGENKIQTNTYIMTYKPSTSPPNIKIGYNIKSVE